MKVYVTAQSQLPNSMTSRLKLCRETSIGYREKHKEHINTLYTGDSRLVDITAGGDFLGLCDQKS